MDDPIVDEVRRIRDEYAARFDYDLNAIYDDLKRIERENPNPRVSLGPRRVAQPVAASLQSSPAKHT